MAFEETVVDYARPLIDLQARLNKISGLSLDKKYKESWELLPACIADVRVLQAVFIIMAEKEKGFSDAKNPEKLQAER